MRLTGPLSGPAVGRQLREPRVNKGPGCSAEQRGPCLGPAPLAAVCTFPRQHSKAAASV